jgi:hypothetical protein
LAASAFNGATTAAVNQTFELRAEPVDNDTASPSGTLNLLFGSGTAAPAGTGLRIASNGQLTFATGQKFPGAGTITGITTATGSGLSGGGGGGTLSLGLLKTCATGQVLEWNGTAWACATASGAGTVTSVASGLGLTGGPIKTSGTLTIDTTKVPLLAAANTFTANQTVNGTGAVGNYGLTVNQPSQTGILLEGPITGPGAGLDFKTTGTGGKQWEILATGKTASQGVGKLNIRDVNSSRDVLTIDASDTVNVNTNLNVAGGAITFAGSQTVNGNITAGTSGSSSSGVLGEANASSGQTYGVGGYASSPAGYGVEGLNLAAGGIGVYGFDGAGIGVYGTGATGVAGVSNSASGPGGSFTGWTAPAGSGLNGMNGVSATGGNSDPNSATNGGDGLVAVGGSSGYTSTAAGNGGAGISAVGGLGRIIYAGEGVSGELAPGGSFIGGNNIGVTANFGGDGIDAQSGLNQGTSEADGYSGNFTGDVEISGLLNGSTPAVKIDDPLDPANKYLLHAPVQSSEIMNIYTGNITTDSQGHATVQLPGWFEVLNTDFRYQLTVIGQFAQAIVARKIENNRFEIRTNAPNVEVSWQVTGVRQDAYAKANPLVVELEKQAGLRGFYIHPELYGAPPEKQIEWARHPQMMKRIKEMQAKQQATIRAAVKPVAAQSK